MSVGLEKEEEDSVCFSLRSLGARHKNCYLVKFFKIFICFYSVISFFLMCQMNSREIFKCPMS